MARGDYSSSTSLGRHSSSRARGIRPSTSYSQTLKVSILGGPYMSRLCIFIIVFFLTRLLGIAATQTETVNYYQCQIEAEPDENFDYAAAQLWMPPEPNTLRGVLCLVLHPLEHGGSTLAHPEPWIQMARRENYALMSISFAQSDDPMRDWCRADKGTGRALLAALTDIAHQSGVSALSNSPIVAVGVCAAGQFAFHLAAFIPKRVESFVTIGGGKHDLSKYKAAISIPALLVTTPDRGPGPVQNLQSLYSEGKKDSAQWQLASEPIAKYDAGFCSSRVISYLRDRLSSPNNVGMHTVNSSEPNWLPISICGTKLPPQIALDTSAVALGTITADSGIRSMLFNIRALSGSPVDSVSALSNDGSIQTSIRKDGPGRWRLDCRLDPAKLALGPFQLPVKLLFEAKNRQLLGEARITLSGSASGPISWKPLALNFNSVDVGQTASASVRIISSEGGPVDIKKVTPPYDWIKTSEHIGSNCTTIVCVMRPPSDLSGQGFTGYLRVELSSPMHRSLKILCFGSIRSSLGSAVKNVNGFPADPKE